MAADEPADDAGKANPSAKPIWSGTISFGLVSIPVMLVPAVRGGGVPLHMLDEDGSPLKRRYVCPEHNKEIHPEHIIRGFEVEDGSYIPVSQEELQKLEPEKSRDIDLTLFVNLEEVDPMYFERSYFLLPTESSNKAYRLLADAMESTGKAGIARFVMREKEYLVTIIAERQLLRAETMRFHDEIRTPEDVGLDDQGKPKKANVSAMTRAIKSLSKPSLAGADLQDHYTQRLLKLIERKAAKREDIVESSVVDADADAEESIDVQDLMASISASVAQAKRRAGHRGRHEDGEVAEPRTADRHGRGVAKRRKESGEPSRRSRRSRSRT